MDLFKGFGTGFKAYGKAFEIIFTKGLWGFFLFPIILNILFLVVGWLGIGSLSDYVESWLQGLMQIEDDSFWGAEYLTTVSTYLSSFAGGVVWLLLKFIFFFVFAYFGGYIVVICLSPVFAALSEKTEENIEQIKSTSTKKAKLFKVGGLVAIVIGLIILIYPFIPFLGYKISPPSISDDYLIENKDDGGFLIHLPIIGDRFIPENS